MSNRMRNRQLGSLQLSLVPFRPFRIMVVPVGRSRAHVVPQLHPFRSECGDQEAPVLDRVYVQVFAVIIDSMPHLGKSGQR